MCKHAIDVFSGPKGSDKYEFRLSYTDTEGSQAIIVTVDTQVNGEVSSKNLRLVEAMFAAASDELNKQDIEAKVRHSYAHNVQRRLHSVETATA